MQGKSVLDLFAGKSESPYAEANQVGYELFGMKALFDGEWKILWMPPPFGKGEWELYNLEKDPAEINDLGNKYPEKVMRMIDLWKQYKKENNVLDISFDLPGATK
ncbi:MAG: hypothetical protein JRI99_07905 [Deltaproteobacteria bacterium]|nr:hypothetical protein [Deltaproteobacteria bacterium]